MSLTDDLKKHHHDISKKEAIEMTTRFRDAVPLMLKPGYPADALPFSETFIKSIFTAISEQSNCVAIRCYFGMDEENKVRIIFLGVDDNNNDILDREGERGGYIFEYGIRCPPICGTGLYNL